MGRNNVEQFSSIGNGLLVRAPAKLNLGLLIAGKRDDGYHEIETVMAKIDYFDELLIERGPAGCGISLVCQGPHWAPTGPENLVHCSAELMLKTFGVATDLNLTLTKKVPAGSGLGSASSDAAATLLGLNRFLGLKLDPDRLAPLAAQLGSDVAFFLHGPLALCRGRGERIQAIESPFPFSALLILPNINVSTESVYRHYRHDRALYRDLAVQLSAHVAENRIGLVAKKCTNMLAETCFSLERRLAELRDKLESAGVRPICMSGSGSALYCIAESRDLSRLARIVNSLELNVCCDSRIVHNNGW